MEFTSVVLPTPGPPVITSGLVRLMLPERVVA
jgi:hypothetical protein